MAILGWMFAGAVIAMLGFMLTHRRRTPYLHLQVDELPCLSESIEAARHTVHLETFVWTAGEVER